MERHRSLLKALVAVVGSAGIARVVAPPRAANAAYTVGGGVGGGDLVTTGLTVQGTLGVASNAGVGTTCPSMPPAMNGIEIVGTSPAVTFTSSGGARRFSALVTYPPVGFYIADSTVGAYRIMLDVNGNVGIGTTSPAQRLDVAGSIRMSGSLLQGSATVIDAAGIARQAYYAP